MITNASDVDALTLLKRARVILTTTGWAQSKDAPKGRGWIQAVDAPVCLGFAVARAYLEHDKNWVGWSDIPDLLTSLRFETVHDCFNWNDTPGRTKEEVLARLDAAIASLEN